MTGIALRSLEHHFKPSGPDAAKCHWCSLGTEYHQNVPRYAQPRDAMHGRPVRSIVPPSRVCETPCVFSEPCDAPCHEVHWLLPLDHSPDACPRLS